MTRAEILSLSKIIGKPRNRNDIERLDLCGITTRRGPSLVERFTMNSATKRQNPLRRARQAGKRGCCAIAVMAKASPARRTKTPPLPPPPPPPPPRPHPPLPPHAPHNPRP